MEMLIISSIFGGIAIVFWLFSIQMKSKRDILLFQVVANIFYAVQYIFINSFSAVSMNIISSLKSYIFYKYEKCGKVIPKYYLIIFLVLIIMFGVVTWNGFISLIPVIITIFYTYSAWQDNAKWIRIVFVVAALFWIYYNFSVKAYISIIGNLFEIMSGVISLFRFRK